MKYTVETVKRLTNDDDRSEEIARAFCNEAMSEVERRFDGLKRLEDGSEILDAVRLAAAADALAGIRHVRDMLQAIAISHHRTDGLGDLFHTSLAEAIAKQDQAERIFQWMDKLYPGRLRC